MKFQQFSVPVQAKGVEDTSFYRDYALLSLNEVGGDPSRFGITAEEFHAGNRVRLERWPRELLATATHDTKRGEDARARLNVLSEMPALWQRTVLEWRQLNAVHRTAVDRKWAPDANDEYLFYQTLVASWPAEELDAPIPTEAAPELVARLRAYMQKAIREAKLHTSWINQNDGLRGCGVPVRRHLAHRIGGPRVSEAGASVHSKHGPGRDGERPRAGRAEGRLAGRTRLLSRYRDVATRHGRSRQSSAGRFCPARGDAVRADALDSSCGSAGGEFDRRCPVRRSRAVRAPVAGRLAGWSNQDVRDGMRAAAPAARASMFIDGSTSRCVPKARIGAHRRLWPDITAGTSSSRPCRG